jgi:hypothetical protein
MTKVVLGIDVGLKNLSLCITAKDEKRYTILLWDNYNLLDKDPELCMGSKVATFSLPSVASYYCKVHSRQVQGAKQLPKYKNAKSYIIQDIARIVLGKITCIYTENTLVFERITSVFIENQPKINNKMKIVSTLILGKLTELLSPKVPIRFISANSKLRIGGVVSCFTSKDNTRGKSGYSNRKKLSVEYTRAFLKNNLVTDAEKWSEHFENRKKLNDMADSLGFCICTLK